MAAQWVRKAALFCLCAVMSPVSGRRESGEGEESTDYRVSLDVRLVLLDVAVLDSKGAFVPDLRREHFRVFEDGRRQTVRFFQQQDVSVTLGLVVDSSGSMQSKRSQVVEAALSFANSRKPGDEMFVINFNDQVHFGLPAGTEFTADKHRLRSALLQTPAEGRTSLYDAVVAALLHAGKGKHDKKVLIVLSDGGDNASRARLPDVVGLARSSSAVVYAAGFLDERNEDKKPAVLKRLARETGGEVFFPENPRDLADVCDRIGQEVRNQYVVGYTPENAGAEGGYRRVKVEVYAANRGKLKSRTRSGYTIRPSHTEGSGKR
jgi:VWFA-related protein